MKCRLINILFRLIPFISFRHWLIASHIEACPHCNLPLQANKQPLPLAFSAEQMTPDPKLWPEICRKIPQEQHRMAAGLLGMNRHFIQFLFILCVVLLLVGVILYTIHLITP